MIRETIGSRCCLCSDDRGYQRKTYDESPIICDLCMVDLPQALRRAGWDLDRSRRLVTELLGTCDDGEQWTALRAEWLAIQAHRECADELRMLPR